MSHEARGLGEAVERAHASIKGARAKLDSVMADVRALPSAYKTNVCQIIEHAFDELRTAELELAEASSLYSDDGALARTEAGLDRP
ncbi:MAG TPA: hypothetical protein VFS00_18185 [Polyangiaceae bacterium]|nr:hypothetical protein [Polyangiaceae bacterium]